MNKTLQQIGIVIVGIAGYEVSKKAASGIADLMKNRVTLDSLADIEGCMNEYSKTETAERLRLELERITILYAIKELDGEKSIEKALNTYIKHLRDGVVECLHEWGFKLTKKALEELDKNSKIRLTDKRSDYQNMNKKEKAS
jgi:hypothetical protein